MSKGRSTKIAVIVIGIGALALLSWALIDNAVMDIQAANIRVGFVFLPYMDNYIFSVFVCRFQLLFSSKGSLPIPLNYKGIAKVQFDF